MGSRCSPRPGVAPFASRRGEPFPIPSAEGIGGAAGEAGTPRGPRGRGQLVPGATNSEIEALQALGRALQAGAARSGPPAAAGGSAAPQASARRSVQLRWPRLRRRPQRVPLLDTEARAWSEARRQVAEELRAAAASPDAMAVAVPARGAALSGPQPPGRGTAGKRGRSIPRAAGALPAAVLASAAPGAPAPVADTLPFTDRLPARRARRQGRRRVGANRALVTALVLLAAFGAGAAAAYFGVPLLHIAAGP